MLRVELFLTQSQWQNDRILSFNLHGLPNFRSVAQVSARRGRDWKLRTTLLGEPLNVIIGWVIAYKARNLLHTSQPPNDSMLVTRSNNHCTENQTPRSSYFSLSIWALRLYS